MNRNQIIETMAQGDIETAAALESAGRFGMAIEHGTGEDAHVAALPGTGQAVVVTNGDAFWFAATSIEDAMEAVESGDYANRPQ